jgi:hypothetical protein
LRSSHLASACWSSAGDLALDYRSPLRFGQTTDWERWADWKNFHDQVVVAAVGGIAEAQRGVAAALAEVAAEDVAMAAEAAVGVA